MLFKKFCAGLITGLMKDRIECWINQVSIISISTYRPLPGGSYVKLPVELRSSKKGPINIKNDNQKCFFWCHVRHINPVKIHPEKITLEDKKLVNNLNYDGIEFPAWEKDFSKIEAKNNICINVYCYENKLTFPIYISDQKFENLMDLLLIIDDKSHYVYIKDFDKFMFPKTKNKNKKILLCKSFTVFIVVKAYWQSIKKFVWALMVHNL